MKTIPYRKLAKELDARSAELGLTADRLETFDRLDRELCESLEAINPSGYAAHICAHPQYEANGGSYQLWRKAAQVSVKWGSQARFDAFRRAVKRDHARAFATR